MVHTVRAVEVGSEALHRHQLVRILVENYVGAVDNHPLLAVVGPLVRKVELRVDLVEGVVLEGVPIAAREVYGN